MAHTHPVVDSDSRFVINSTTREISTTSDKLELIQGDHQSERITFEIPKIVEGHDMSLSDRIEVHYINIDRRTNATSRDVYIIDDAAVDGDKLTFSWLISGNATKYYGRLNFIILFECLDPDGNYTYKWNTEICKLLTIGEGISNTSAVIEDHSDILEKFKKEILEEAGEKSIQPDWNQNDDTKPDYMKNRPFYTGDQVETVFVEESTVSFAPEEGVYIGGLQSTFVATVGETYKVSWDGTTYESTCVNFNGLSVIGNLSISGTGSDTGEPFLANVDNGKRIMIGTADTSASHTFSISGFVTEVVKIDEKYLPDTIATKSDVEVAKTTANNAKTTANNAKTTANNAQTTADDAKTTANNAKSEALDLAARMFGHTSVVDNAFYRDETLSITSLPACIESIGAYAFAGCRNLALTSLPSGLTSISVRAFADCTNLALTSLPSGLTSIDHSVFKGCRNLALTSLPSGLTSIGAFAFSDCTNLALTSLPSGITSIGVYAFQSCTGLTSITFTGKPTTINSEAFKGCTNLTTINVPWAEGEVANSPWGATNATINYNYTEV